MTLGLVVPYSPEYRASGTDLGLLSELARVTGGEELLIPMAAFVHNLPAADFAREIWRPLLLAVALLFPLDVALRRLVISQNDLRKARAWLRAKLPGGQRSAAERPRMLGELFRARERVRQRQSGAQAPPVELREEPLAEELEESSAAKPDSEPGEQDSLARLREAKKRASRE
jgi:hypothetical protein